MRAVITQEEYAAAAGDGAGETSRLRKELFLSKGLPVKENGTFDLDNF